MVDIFAEREPEFSQKIWLSALCGILILAAGWLYLQFETRTNDRAADLFEFKSRLVETIATSRYNTAVALHRWNDVAPMFFNAAKKLDPEARERVLAGLQTQTTFLQEELAATDRLSLWVREFQPERRTAQAFGLISSAYAEGTDAKMVTIRSGIVIVAFSAIIVLFMAAIYGAFFSGDAKRMKLSIEIIKTETAFLIGVVTSILGLGAS